MYKKLEEIFVERLLFTAAISSTIITIFIIAFIFVQGLPAINKAGFFNFMFGTEWLPLEGVFGALPMIIGSLYITGLALLMAIPLSLSCAIFLAEIAPRQMRSILKPTLQALAGIPSVVYGFFGMVIIVPFIREQFGGTGFSVLAASLILTIMVLPIITSISEDAIKSIPLEYKEASLALGATHWQTIKYVLFPAAAPGIITAIILGLARGIGETLIIMVAGNVALIPGSIFDPARALTANIALEMGYAGGIHYNALFATGIILFFMTVVLLVIANYIRYKKRVITWLPLMSSKIEGIKKVSQKRLNLKFRIISPKNAQKIMKGVFWGSGILAILILLSVVGYILINGLHVVNLEFLLDSPIRAGREGGIFPMIVSTIYVTLIGVLVATPLGVGAAVYLAEYASGESRIVKAIRFCAETLASVPSIVFGLFGLAFFVIYLDFGFSVLSGGLY
jgi:phosphate transport system permease protein